MITDTITTITPAVIIQTTSTTMGMADVSVTVPRSPPSGSTDAEAALLPLMLWLSPAFPVGSFAYSQGLEWAVESGDIQDARSLGGWLVELLTFGAPRADALLFSECFHAAAAEDWEALAAANELAVALANSAERRLETTSQGAAFVVAARAAWDCEPLRQLSLEERVAYPAAVASAAAGHGLPLEASLHAFILAQIAAAVSAVVRLGPIGQTDGQKIQATLIPRIRALAREASGSSLADLGSCAFRSDIAAMRHETQYSRLFRS